MISLNTLNHTKIENYVIITSLKSESVGKLVNTRGVQYVMKTAQYIPKFNIYTLRNYLNLKVCFLAKYM